MPPRAAPMAPEDRRAAIIASVEPLIAAHGASVTTRQLADAAGVAEGTLFRAFGDKAGLIREVARAGLDPEPIREWLLAIDPGARIDGQVRVAAELLGGRFERILAIMGALRATVGDEGHHEVVDLVAEANSTIHDALTEFFARHADRLTLPPDRVAVVFRALVFAACHPIVPADQRPTVEEITDVVVGALVTGERPCS